jgi:hypothetical protein
MPTGLEVLDRAIAAHGGEARWKSLQRIDVVWTFRGMMFKMRLRENKLRSLSAHIDTRRPEVEVEPFMKEGTVGRFTPSSVTMEQDGTQPATLEHPREAFNSKRTLFWWKDLEMLYFSGYVLWNYTQLPFLLLQPGIRIENAGTSQQGDEIWDKVSVTFPDNLPTHSPQQTFYFGPDGLLKRHDYHVAIMSKLARGARYIHSYHEVDGFKLPARIEIKLGKSGEKFARWPSLGFVDLDDYSLR